MASENGNGAAGDPADLSEEDRDLQFRKLADSFIDVANRHCNHLEPPMINSAFLYGASRFCAFVVAGKTGDLKSYQAQRDAALDYYTNEFKTMLEQNLDDYCRVFENDSDSESGKNQ